MQSFLVTPADSGHLLKQFVYEFTQALAERFSFQGILDPTALSERMPERYGSPAEALALVESVDEISLFSIETSSFHLLLDLSDDGVEMLYKARTPDASVLVGEFRQLAQRILARIFPLQA